MTPEENAIYTAWKEQLNYEATPEQFADCYEGIWESFEDYANEFTVDYQAGWPEEAIRYFDWAKFTRDLRYDFEVVELDDGQVAVLSAL